MMKDLQEPLRRTRLSTPGPTWMPVSSLGGSLSLCTSPPGPITGFNLYPTSIPSAQSSPFFLYLIFMCLHFLRCKVKQLWTSSQLHVSFLPASGTGKNSVKGSMVKGSNPPARSRVLPPTTKAFLLPSYPASSDLLSPFKKTGGSVALSFVVITPWKPVQGLFWVVSPPRAGRHPCTPGFQGHPSFPTTPHVYHLHIPSTKHRAQRSSARRWDEWKDITLLVCTT